MGPESLVERLRLVELLEGLSDRQLEEIARKAERVSFEAGDTIIAEDQAGDAAYLILAGEAVRSALDEDEGPIAVPLHALIGEMAMLIEISHTATVTCRGSVEALKLARSMMHGLMARDPDLAERLLEKIAERLQRAAGMLRYADEVIARAPSHLVELSVRLPLPPVATSEIEMQPHHLSQ
jgi:CRP-like cAMP-binding protein